MCVWQGVGGWNGEKVSRRTCDRNLALSKNPAPVMRWKTERKHSMDPTDQEVCKERVSTLSVTLRATDLTNSLCDF